jgi:hypothetical protein
LARYLSNFGNNSSRYSSNETSSSFFTQPGSGLTGIFRQNANLTLKPQDITESYGTTQYGFNGTDSSNILIPNIAAQNFGLVNNDSVSIPNGSVLTPTNFSTAGFQKKGGYDTSFTADFLNNLYNSNIIKPLLFPCGNTNCYSYMVNGLGYLVNTSSGKLNITSKTLNITNGLSITPKTYDGNTDAIVNTNTVVFAGNIPNDKLSG